MGFFFQVQEGHEYKPFAYYSRSVLRINVTEMANYTCHAINQMIGGRQSVDQESFMVYVQDDQGRLHFIFAPIQKRLSELIEIQM